ncbi:MAG TPA: flavoprotein [Tepidisphaeraceae bacterium]|jgi:phosphopantothenoylcysteine decarboxylase/phosphopantothenate--cysteine ligase|nr:flavoprotein [Tepidisphaeraceae bacterium]
MEKSPAAHPALNGRAILLAITAGISAYKSADLTSKLVQAGVNVQVVMTPEATKFVTPLTFESLSGKKVLIDPWNLDTPADPQHIGLTERADLMLIAPATANTLAKIAHGLCDDLVSLLACAAACPIAYAPAMNNRMWVNPITLRNVQILRDAGHHFIGPEDGWLACRNTGPGRMSEPTAILEQIARIISAKSTLV